MTSRRPVLTALALSGLLAATACADAGSPDADGAPTTTIAWHRSEGGGWNADAVAVRADDLDCRSPAPDPTRGVTDTAVKIGGLGTMSGPTIAVYPELEDGARARFARANAEGGVHGRRIDFIGMEDDGLDPARQVDGARRLVAEGVFAVAPMMTQLPNFRQTFCDAVMPHFGWGVNSGWCDTAVGFALTGCIVSPKEPEYLAVSSGTVDSLIDGRPKTIALVGNDEEASRLGNKVIRGGFESAGYKVVYDDSPLSSRTPLADASPVVHAIMTADEGAPPSFVYLVADFANTNTMVQALTAGGFDGTILSAVGYDPRLASAPAFDGVYTTLQWAPFEAASVPFVAQMVADFDRYAPNAPKALPSAAGYAAADMLVAALQRAGRNLTVDAFLAALNDNWVYSTPGFRGDAHFPANHVIAVPCGTHVQLREGRFVPGPTLQCTDPVKR